MAYAYISVSLNFLIGKGRSHVVRQKEEEKNSSISKIVNVYTHKISTHEVLNISQSLNLNLCYLS